MPDKLSISVSVSLDRASEQMFDIAEELRYLVAMAPLYHRGQAEAAKDRIIQTMASWLNESEDTKTHG